MSRQDIADYSAMTIGTVSRGMTELKERDILEMNALGPSRF
ncbi:MULTISPECIES: helix-turn-helix domain-containing protein [Rhizobium]|nr:helix-turn-helix domain-containing protein [Rhizobium mesoamericanum]